MFNVFIGIIWQTALVAVPIYIILMRPTGIVVCLLLIGATTLILKNTWWDYLPTDATEADRGLAPAHSGRAARSEGDIAGAPSG